jgi:hypothetical protein
MKLAYLLARVSARVARKNIAINIVHAASPCVVDGRGSIRIGVAAGLVHADDRENVARRDHAGKTAGVCSLRHIHAVRSGDYSDQSQANKRKHDKHLMDRYRWLNLVGKHPTTKQQLAGQTK